MLPESDAKSDYLFAAVHGEESYDEERRCMLLTTGGTSYPVVWPPGARISSTAPLEVLLEDGTAIRMPKQARFPLLPTQWRGSVVRWPPRRTRTATDVPPAALQPGRQRPQGYPVGSGMQAGVPRRNGHVICRQQ